MIFKLSRMILIPGEKGKNLIKVDARHGHHTRDWAVQFDSARRVVHFEAGRTERKTRFLNHFFSLFVNMIYSDGRGITAKELARHVHAGDYEQKIESHGVALQEMANAFFSSSSEPCKSF